MGKLKPVTPGELLLEEFLKPMGISQYRLAKEISVPAQRIRDIVAGKRGSLLILICGFAASSACPTAIGCVRRPPMTLRSLSAQSVPNW